eukprot:SAG11_NODE_410_length_9703_cov_3.284777_7_plen_85_part_00
MQTQDTLEDSASLSSLREDAALWRCEPVRGGGPSSRVTFSVSLRRIASGSLTDGFTACAEAAAAAAGGRQRQGRAAKDQRQRQR